ncbi:MAG: serine/threonine-protein kinase [Kofleriaceae bacterium]
MPPEVPLRAPPTEPDLEPLPLRRLGDYELIKRVARGGMADIYLAHRVGGGERPVALKVLNPRRAKEAEACQMFLDEARVVALLDHHNIAAVLEVDVVDDQYYLAMEFVHGVDLRELLACAVRKQVDVPYETAVAIVVGAATGLDHAHRRTGPDGRPLCVVHRDVSLSNIMIGHDGSVKVVDFGIAQTAIATVHTSPGVVRGKASYMSPEQCLGDPVDHRADVFALGIVLYELTTGARCFSGKSDFERMLAVVRGEWLPPSQLDARYPRELELVVRRALATDPAQRYASASELCVALEQLAIDQLWVLGASSIARLARELFGEVPEPWAPITYRAPPPRAPPRVTRTARGTEPPVLARGSEPDLLRACAWQPAPTRMTSRRAVAAHSGARRAHPT